MKACDRLSVVAVNKPSSTQQSLRQEVASRFGLVPNFFLSAPDAPEVVERLWDFAKSAYLDNALPSLFKERLFVYLALLRSALLHHAPLRLPAGIRPFLGRSVGTSADRRTGRQAAANAGTLAPPVENVFESLEGLGELTVWPEPEAPAESWICIRRSNWRRTRSSCFDATRRCGSFCWRIPNRADATWALACFRNCRRCGS